MSNLRLMNTENFPNEKVEHEQTFSWVKGTGKNKKTVAYVTIYPDGLIEFSGNGKDIAIERVGEKDQTVCIGDLEIK